MKKINFRKINVFISALLALSLSLASCSSEIEDDSGKDKDTACLKINVAADSRTILPDFDVTVMEYTLYGKLDGGERRTLATFPDYKSLQTDIISLESGNWEFELEGVSYTSVNLPDDFSHGYINGTYYDRDNLNSRIFGSVFNGLVEKAIQKGTNDVSFVLSLKSDYTSFDSYYYDLQGNYHPWCGEIKVGSIDVTLNLPSDSMVYVKASLNSLDERPDPVSVTENLTVQNSSVSFKKDDVNCGYYELIFEFYDDQDYQVKLNTYKEVVKVVAGCTSRAEIIIPLLNDYKDFNAIGFELHGGQFASGYYPLENFVPNQKTKLPNALQVVHDGGYVLEGFYDNAEYTGKRYTELEGFAENVTMHAKWVKGIAVTSDKVKDLNLSTITEPQALVCFGEMTSDIKAAIEKAANFIDLILVDTKTFVSFNDDWGGEILPKLRSVVIPNGVTEIGYCAFYGCTNLASITIPSSVTKIGGGAFNGCSKLNKLYLEDINSYLKIEFVSSPFASSSGPNRIYVNNVEVTDIAIPEGVNVIASAVFNRCSNLASITIPSSVTEIGYGAFDGCSSLASITIPSSVTKIGSWAFHGCSSLDSIVIPSSVTKIGEYTFYECGNLTSVTIPSSVIKIGGSAFYDCSKLSNLYLEDISSYLSIEYGDSCSWPFYSSTGPNRIYVNNVEVTDITIPDGVEEISPYAFRYCANITSVKIPSSFTAIGSETFIGWTSLTSVTIPSSVTVIGANAFGGCSSLSSVTIPSSVTEIGSWAFVGCSKLSNLYLEDISSYLSIEFEDSCSCPFSNSSGPNKIYVNNAEVTDLVIPEGVEEISPNAFSNCANITSVKIPSSVTEIGDFAFYECSGLASITIPSSVTVIGDNAFRGCSSLSSVTIPSSVTKIGSWAFAGCSKLSNLYLEDISSYLSIEFQDSYSWPFSNSSGPNKIYVNNVEVTDLVIPEGVEEISPYAFQGCTFNSIVLPSTVTEINSNTLSGLSFTSITIPSSVTEIGNYAFYGCTSLASITIPSSLTKIGSGAFEGCSNLSNLHLEDISLYLSIEYGNSYSWPFSYSSGPNKIYVNNVEVTDFVIPDGFEEISPYAFRGCTFNSIVLPSTVTEINSNTLSGLSFTSITIPSSVTVIGDNAFYGHSSLASITIPSSVTYIGDWAFYGCNSLASITIPSLVTRIGECAFHGCSGLTSITIPSSVTEIGWNAFGGCDNIDTIWVDDMDSYNNISGDRPYSGTVKVKIN